MTATVASLGMLPAALASGIGTDVPRNLATVGVGGLILATLLTLFILPTYYFALERWGQRRQALAEPDPERKCLKMPKWSKGMRAGLAVAASLLCPFLCHAQMVGATPQPQDIPKTSEQAEQVAPERWAIHGQTTIVWQLQPAFRSLYYGPHSLYPAANGRETIDLTIYLGVRPWKGAGIWANPEMDQGFGLSNTFGVAGYPSGEAYKLGRTNPYFKFQRCFFRQTINLGGETEKVNPDLNQLGGAQTSNRLVITIGKYSVVDLFDTNKYAHDPRNDFFNWSIIGLGSFDYAADSWGYTYGAAAEWQQDWWTARVGMFDLSSTPNSRYLDEHFSQWQFVGEL